ncbi:MAG: hypothetical protein AB8C02_14120 [Halioglobus sp.]
MNLKQLLSERLVEPVSARIGDRLVGVTYRCLEHEISDESELEDPQLYIGGELHLSFSNSQLVVTWDENAGWPDHFSLYAGVEPQFLPDALMESWRAGHLSPWIEVVNQTLTAAIVFSDNETPHALALHFGQNSVVVGDGSETRFGDGDDLLIRDKRGLAALNAWETMWSSV